MKKHCNRTAEGLVALEQAKISGLHQITSLRTVFKSLATSFDKLNEDVEESLSQKDKGNIREIAKDTMGAMDRCEDTICKIKALTKKKLRSKSELDVLRNELNDAMASIQCLQISLNTSVSRPLTEAILRLTLPMSSYISLETLRVVSVIRRGSELEDFQPASRRATIDSTWSMSTLAPALSSESTYSTGSSSGSTSNSPNSTRSTAFVKSKQLCAAVQEEDSKLIEQLIRQTSTEAEVSTLVRTRFRVFCLCY